jgi:hypothetical protein
VPLGSPDRAAVSSRPPEPGMGKKLEAIFAFSKLNPLLLAIYTRELFSPEMNKKLTEWYEAHIAYDP